MPNFRITEVAGRYVAGVRNTGVGTTISLTEKQAEAALRDGTIVEAGATAPDSPFAVATVTDTAASPRAEVDSVPQSTDPDAPARPAGTATIAEAVEQQRAAEGATDVTPPAVKKTAAPRAKET